MIAYQYLIWTRYQFSQSYQQKFLEVVKRDQNVPIVVENFTKRLYLLYVL